MRMSLFVYVYSKIQDFDVWATPWLRLVPTNISQIIVPRVSLTSSQRFSANSRRVVGKGPFWMKDTTSTICAFLLAPMTTPSSSFNAEWWESQRAATSIGDTPWALTSVSNFLIASVKSSAPKIFCTALPSGLSSPNRVPVFRLLTEFPVRNPAARPLFHSSGQMVSS